MTTVLLVRHGESAWNAAGRVQGWAPVGLTDTGRREAAAVADRVGEYDVDRIVTSDLRRARKTAEIVADVAGARIRKDPAWRERNFGALQGVPADGLLERFPELDLLESDDAASERPESGESWLDVRERTLSAFEGVTGADGDETVAVVTHFAPILLVVGAVRGEDVATALTERRVGTGSITELRRADGTWRVVETDRRPADDGRPVERRGGRRSGPEYQPADWSGER